MQDSVSVSRKTAIKPALKQVGAYTCKYDSARNGEVRVMV